MKPTKADIKREVEQYQRNRARLNAWYEKYHKLPRSERIGFTK